MDDCECHKWPTGYIQAHEYAEKMMKTHKQVRAKECGKYCLWEPRKKRVKKVKEEKATE